MNEKVKKYKYLVTAEEIDQMEGVQKTHFLNPDAKRVNKSLGDITGLDGIGFHLITVQPGDATTEHHMHYHEDECVYVLSGNATAYIGEESFPIKTGDFLGYRKGGLAHSIVNTGNEVLKCIIVGERLKYDVADYARLKKRLYRHEGMEWNLVDIRDLSYPKAGKK